MSAARRHAPACAGSGPAPGGLRPIPDLSDAEFARIGRIVLRIAGIRLTEGKEQLVKSRLWRRLQHLSLDSFRAYADLIESKAGGAEIAFLLDALTTNETQFFREPQHLRFLDAQIRAGRLREGVLRIWSAGCSSGEEPYSIAITVREAMGPPAASRVRILGTDISTHVLRRARAGCYSVRDVASLPPGALQRYFVRIRQDGLTAYRVGEEIRPLVRFARLNLLDPWPMRGPFDAIFCRNVMIYFDRDAQLELLARFREILRPGGYLILGHAESLAGRDRGFTYLMPAVYGR